MITGARVLIIANARYPIREPFAGGLEAWTWALVRGLRARGADVTIFAGAGSDPGLAARELPTAPFKISEVARADVSMPPDAWMREHHAYLQAMLFVLRSEARFDIIPAARGAAIEPHDLRDSTRRGRGVSRCDGAGTVIGENLGDSASCKRKQVSRRRAIPPRRGRTARPKRASRAWRRCVR
jgi:hypothetical protein